MRGDREIATIAKRLLNDEDRASTNGEEADQPAPPPKEKERSRHRPQPPPQFQQMATAVSGMVSGIAGVILTHPLDVIKTRMQVSDGAGFTPQYSSVRDAVGQIWRSEGVRGLYSGLVPAVLASSLSWGLYFSLYDSAKKRYARQSESGETNARIHLLSATEAGGIATAITNPLWVIKTRMELQRSQARTASAAAASAAAAASGGPGGLFAPTPGVITDLSGAGAGAGVGTMPGPVATPAPAARVTPGGRRPPPVPRLSPADLSVPLNPVEPPAYRGTLDAIKTIAQREGLGGFYRGLVPSLILVGHGAVQLVVYEELKALAVRLKLEATGRPSRKALETMGDPNLSKLSFWEVGFISLAAKAAASTVTYPLQVARARLQQRFEGRTLQYRGLLDVIARTVRAEGPLALYKGLVPNLLRVAPQSAVTFITYELMMDAMHGLPVGRSGDRV